MSDINAANGKRKRRILVTHTQIASSAIKLLNDHDIDVYFSPPYNPSEEVARIAAELQIDALMVRQGKINEQVIAASPKLKLIVKHGVGVDNVDINAAHIRNIPVLRSMGSNALAVAELAISLSLALIKEFPRLDQATKQGEWLKPGFIGRDIAGSHIGLIGFGAIGKETARLATALGMDVSVSDPYARDDIIARGYKFEQNFEDILRQVDIVSMHCPLTHETRAMINHERIALMKKTSFIVNTARGGVIDEKALYEALRDGVIAGAGLDSFAEEPPATDNPLWSAPNVIVTPHIGGVTHHSTVRMAEIAARHIISVLDGNPPDPASIAHPAALAS